LSGRTDEQTDEQYRRISPAKGLVSKSRDPFIHLSAFRQSAEWDPRHPDKTKKVQKSASSFPLGQKPE
jgi:hypothetical protein